MGESITATTETIVQKSESYFANLAIEINLPPRNLDWYTERKLTKRFRYSNGNDWIIIVLLEKKTSGVDLESGMETASHNQGT